ncbi:MAG: PEP-CTERM sorting domain-containing protein [Acidobacteriia bacterium]|nr:PEP-CTERM sorting domain-containing protein [Terriglobia bacterium]
MAHALHQHAAAWRIVILLLATVLLAGGPCAYATTILLPPTPALPVPATAGTATGAVGDQASMLALLGVLTGFNAAAVVQASDAPSIGVVGSDGASWDGFSAEATLTMITTTIPTDGFLFLNWMFQTADAGSFWDPAGYIVTNQSPVGTPIGIAGLNVLTAGQDFTTPPLLGTGNSPFTEVNIFDGIACTDVSTPNANPCGLIVPVSAGDTFGLFVLTPDNQANPGSIVAWDALSTGDPLQIMLSDLINGVPDPANPGQFLTPPAEWTVTTLNATPEPATLLLMGGGLLAMAMVVRRRKA